MRRLAPNLTGPILRASADRHQTLIFTEGGSVRVRMRFSDVVEELADMPGARIHRSHWLAYDAISQVQPDGRRFLATLGCGAQVPVSQNGAEALREAGVLAA